MRGMGVIAVVAATVAAGTAAYLLTMKPRAVVAPPLTTAAAPKPVPIPAPKAAPKPGPPKAPAKDSPLPGPLPGQVDPGLTWQDNPGAIPPDVQQASQEASDLATWIEEMV